MKIIQYISIILAIFLIQNQILLSFSGTGSGTLSDPYQIRTLNQLQEMNDDLTAHYILMNNIDASATSGWNGGIGFIPIAYNNNFTGSLDGNYYYISDLYINRTDVDSRVGLFSYLSNSSEVKNLGLRNVDIRGRGECGALAGFTDWGTVISNCYSSGTIRCDGGDAAGGLIGWATLWNTSGTTITNSYSTCSVYGINGADYGGGFCGWSQNSSFTDCYSTGAVSGFQKTGGFLGGCDQSNILRSYSSSSASGSGDDGTGGFCGYLNNSTINKCYSIGTVTGSNYCGGFGGRIISSNINNCYSTSNVSGDFTGGFGGLFNNCSINYCYSTGYVQGNQGYFGGFGSENFSSSTNFTRCYFDYQTAGINDAIAVGSETGVSGETTDNMYSQFTYSNWDFNNIWYICTNDYPRLNGLDFLAEVWVSSSFCSTCSNGNHTWKCDAFDNFDDAHLRVNTGGTIHTVGSYTYTGDLNVGDSTKAVIIDIGNNSFVIDGDFNINGNITFIGAGTITVTGDLNFVQGKLNIGPISIIVEGDMNGYNENKYIIATGTGRVIVTTHSAVEVPVGTETGYYPVIIEDEEGMTFGVRTDKQPSLPGTGGLAVNWDISYMSEATPNSTLSFIYPKSSVESGYDPNAVIIYHYDSENMEWEAYENSSTEVWSQDPDYYITTVGGVDDFSPFAVRTTQKYNIPIMPNHYLLLFSLAIAGISFYFLYKRVMS